MMLEQDVSEFASTRDLMLAALNHQWQIDHDRVVRVAFGADEPPLKRIERLLDMVAALETSNKGREGHVLGCPFGNPAAESGILGAGADGAGR